MTPQTVLVVENDSLLGASIESLLNRQTDLNIVGVSPKSEASLIREIWYVRPCVVILNENSWLTTPSRLLARLRNYPRLRLVVVNADHNWVQVYDKQHISTAQGKNLTAALERSFDVIPAYVG